MYNVDDAVARVDSYIVSVTGGGRHVGERRLVRIEGVGRSSADRLAAGRQRRRGGDGDGEKLESAASGGRKRGRGSRGGRRRSRAGRGAKKD